MKKRLFISRKNLFKILLWVVVCFVVGLLIGWIVRSCRAASQPDPYRDYPAVVTSVRSALKLATAQVYHEQTVVDTLHGVVVAMVVESRSLISFDLDKMPTRVQGDTLFLQLPPEEITHYETGLNVVDHYALHPLTFPEPITAAEENQVKAQIPALLTQRLYRQGYVRRARQSALRQVRNMVGIAFPYVVVIDRYPNGVQGTVFTDTIPPLKLQNL